MLKIGKDYWFPEGTTAFGHRLDDPTRQMEEFSVGQCAYYGIDEKDDPVHGHKATGYYTFRARFGADQAFHVLYMEPDVCLALLNMADVP